MSHSVRLFAGPKRALRPFVETVPGTLIFALTADAPAYVITVDDRLLDALHACNGTGEWLDAPAHPDAAPPQLTTTDLTFAALASTGTALAYLETAYFGGIGHQTAAVWIDGKLAMRPAIAHTSEARPSKLLPINGALRLIGVAATYATPADDEFAAFGLQLYRNHEAVAARALPVGRA
ncbi:MAG: hypothetical protein SH859_00255 [Hyphomicrobium aestuarii]|nr:hypothetical protein [Hyphomicrobium aestuarii]